VTRALLAAVLALLSAAAQAMFSGSIVDAGFVAKASARGAIVVDVRGTEAYFDGHVPGAINLDVPATFIDETTHGFAPIGHIDAALGEAGIDLKREIVVYGRAADTFPYFTQFALEYFGARRAHVFHQGIEGWRAARRPVSTAPSTRRPVKVRPFANPAMLATSGEVLARIGKPSVQFLDVRRPGEFNGDQSETLRGGHIPGAINIAYDAVLVDPDTPRLKPRKALRALYAALDPKKEIIVYGQVGWRAAMTASVLARIGYHSVRLYMPGWYEYGNLPDAPVEQ
jgi:thiosulfate/3-mercaptopyruvate sulfurtransferase